MALRIYDKMQPPKDDPFPILDAEHVSCKVQDREGKLTDFMFVPITQKKYNEMKADGKLNPNTPYLIIAGDDA